MILENMNDMKWYMEKKFSSDAYNALARPLEDFQEVVKFEIIFTPKQVGLETHTANMWCNINARTASAPFKK